MGFMDLSETSGLLFLSFFLFASTILLISTIMHIHLSNKKIISIIFALLFLSSIILISSYVEIFRYVQEYDLVMTELSLFINSIPLYVHVVFTIFMIALSIIMLIKLNTLRKTKLNDMSIKEAIENLPTGLIFMSEYGDLFLSNRIIHQLCIELTSKNLVSGKAFWNDIKSLESSDKCVLKGEMPAFLFSDNEVWQFSQTPCIIDEVKYFQIKATKITDLFNLSININDANVKLLNQQVRLKKLYATIEENAAQKVALDMKIKFHDNFGNIIMMTRKVLKEKENEDETENLIGLWDEFTSTITQLSGKEGIANLNLDEIEALAQEMDCSLKISGVLPENELINQIMLLAINETLKNAIHHAKAKELIVNIAESQQNHSIVIQNKLNKPHIKIVEGGGLAGLRKKVEEVQGVMNITTNEIISVQIDLPKI